jgi:cobalamin biosynthesis Mg chelatase CobN
LVTGAVPLVDAESDDLALSDALKQTLTIVCNEENAERAKRLAAGLPVDDIEDEPTTATTATAPASGTNNSGSSSSTPTATNGETKRTSSSSSAPASSASSSSSSSSSSSGVDRRVASNFFITLLAPTPRPSYPWINQLSQPSTPPSNSTSTSTSATAAVAATMTVSPTSHTKATKASLTLLVCRIWHINVFLGARESAVGDPGERCRDYHFGHDDKHAILLGRCTLEDTDNHTITDEHDE